MGERYSHLSLMERRRIEEMFQASIPVREIAERLGRHRGTIRGHNIKWAKNHAAIISQRQLIYCFPLVSVRF